jgi:hypothetical protein
MLLQRCGLASSSVVKQRTPAVVVRAVAEPTTKAAAERNGAAKLNGNGASKAEPYFLNVIPETSWEKGIPPVMVRGAGASRGRAAGRGNGRVRGGGARQ